MRRVLDVPGAAGIAATLSMTAVAVAFLVVRPPVGDMWAARAHQSAVEHGVGLTYWFSWFGGTSPGGYSVLTPYLAAALGSAITGALATAATPAVCWLLVRGTSHPVAATWVSMVVSAGNLWSGRIPFAVGTFVTVLALLAVRGNRRVLAILAGVATSLVSPVSGAFLIIGLAGPLTLCRDRRVVSALTIAGAGSVLAVVAALFGVPGPQPFGWTDGRAVILSLLAMLLARPAADVLVVTAIAAVACPFLVVLPNGLGSNFVRLAWICLPVAVVATARARVGVAALVSALGIYYGLAATMHDLGIARSPLSSLQRYAPLAAELGRLPRLTSYRLEVVADGTHTSAYALLDDALLARGYETQADNAYAAVLLHPGLTGRTYRAWLADNAVGYVALGSAALQPNPESRLVSHGLDYLDEVWSDAHWRLYRVRDARPIAAAPAEVVSAGQAQLGLRVTRAAQIPVRVRWSGHLEIDTDVPGASASLRSDGHGWTVLDARAPGVYFLRG